MIREGTAARNLEALVPLLCDKYVERCMFCTDDKHPNDLLEKGHIDYIVKKAISLGADPITAIKAACHNAARYFLLNNRGAIAPGYLADFVIIDDFDHFNIEKGLQARRTDGRPWRGGGLPRPGDRPLSGQPRPRHLPMWPR